MTKLLKNLAHNEKKKLQYKLKNYLIQFKKKDLY